MKGIQSLIAVEGPTALYYGGYKKSGMTLSTLYPETDGTIVH